MRNCDGYGFEIIADGTAFGDFLVILEFQDFVDVSSTSDDSRCCCGFAMVNMPNGSNINMGFITIENFL